MQRRTKICGAFGAFGGAALLTAVAVGAAASGGAPASTVAIPMADPTPAESSAYPGTVATSTSVSGSDRVRSGTRQLVTVEVSTAGDARPQGMVTVVFRKEGGGYQEVRSVPYTGSAVSVESSFLDKPGRYFAEASFRADGGSVWQDSDGSFSFQVTGSGNDGNNGNGNGNGNGNNGNGNG